MQLRIANVNKDKQCSKNGGIKIKILRYNRKNFVLLIDIFKIKVYKNFII